MFELTGKTAVVTGAGSGIGKEIALLFGRQGAHVIVADINIGSAENTVAEIESAGGVATAQLLDVTKSEQVASAYESAMKHSSRVDVLVNNAGLGHVGTALTTSGDDLDRLYAVNVRGILLMSQTFLPQMIERRSGSVINIASIGGIIGIVDRLAYCTTKFAVVGMTKCMALDHALSQVRVNCICPGRVETPFVQARLREYPNPEKAYAEMTATQALNRMGRPDEIAAAALYLAADESSFVTGSSLIIDGGWSAGT